MYSYLLDTGHYSFLLGLSASLVDSPSVAFALPSSGPPPLSSSRTFSKTSLDR